MLAEALELDQLTRSWWLGENPESVFQRILDRSLTDDPGSLVPFARALQILETQQLRPAFNCGSIGFGASWKICGVGSDRSTN